MKDHVEMPNYTKVGYHSEHPVHRNEKDNKIRDIGEEHEGIHHTITRHGAPYKGYQPQHYEGNINPPKGNKISGMPPHEKCTFGEPVSGHHGAMRNEMDEDEHGKRNVTPRHAKKEAY